MGGIDNDQRGGVLFNSPVATLVATDPFVGQDEDPRGETPGTQIGANDEFQGPGPDQGFGAKGATGDFGIDNLDQDLGVGEDNLNNVGAGGLVIDANNELNRTNAAAADLSRLQGFKNSTVSDAGSFVMADEALNMHCWGQNPVVTAKLQLNGQDRFSEREGTYFGLVQPYQHHTRVPDTGINVYSFALRPEEHHMDLH